MEIMQVHLLRCSPKVAGQGVNDLRPDPMVVPNELSFDVSIPQVGEDVEIDQEFKMRAM